MKEVTSLQSPVVVCSDVVHVHRPRGCGFRTCDEERPRGGKTEESENCLGQPNPFPTFAFWPETQAQDIRDNAVIQLSWFFKRSHILRSIKRFSPKMRLGHSSPKIRATILAVLFQTQLLAQAWRQKWARRTETATHIFPRVEASDSFFSCLCRKFSMPFFSKILHASLMLSTLYNLLLWYELAPFRFN